ncbi:hypothetical protein PYCCODRAFT_9658 [Trametes coccinea BRFM310]|uniref:Uncharacterized protein n=1 Tax=Trametes coccinea (strain BRFM310) TaxID=1353009 RepID=A0A1Y2J7T4_TRAC3|nr:hypothetical protein PYCCODRAFT_9658 [Trametes coccinea BRFM310]
MSSHNEHSRPPLQVLPPAYLVGQDRGNHAVTNPAYSVSPEYVGVRNAISYSQYPSGRSPLIRSILGLSGPSESWRRVRQVLVKLTLCLIAGIIHVCCCSLDISCLPRPALAMVFAVLTPQSARSDYLSDGARNLAHQRFGQPEGVPCLSVTCDHQLGMALPHDGLVLPPPVGLLYQRSPQVSYVLIHLLQRPHARSAQPTSPRRGHIFLAVSHDRGVLPYPVSSSVRNRSLTLSLMRVDGTGLAESSYMQQRYYTWDFPSVSC